MTHRRKIIKSNNRAEEAGKPTPKSRNKKSLGPSLRASSGTRKTDAGARKGIERLYGGAGSNDNRPSAAGAKPGTVHRSSKTDRGYRPTAKEGATTRAARRKTSAYS